MCARAPVAAAALMTVSMARRSATGGLEATKASYPGPFGTLISAGSSACTIMGAPPAASSFIAARSSSRDSGGNSAIPESIRKHLNPTTPASSSGPIAAAFPGTAPPQNATSTAHCPAAAAAFSRSASTDDGHRHGVQRHVADRRHPAGQRGPRRGREPLPLGPPRLVDVHVRVHEPGQQGEVAEIDVAVSVKLRVVGVDRFDLFIPNVRRRLPHPIWQHHAGRPDDERLAHSHPKLPALSDASDGRYSSPTHPLYPCSASCPNNGSKSTVPVPGAPRPGGSATWTCQIFSRYVSSTPGRSSPIFPRWYRSARSPTLGAPTAFDDRDRLVARVDRERGNVDGVDRLDQHGGAGRSPPPGRRA